jgi:hypothetical protein
VLAAPLEEKIDLDRPSFGRRPVGDLVEQRARVAVGGLVLGFEG